MDAAIHAAMRFGLGPKAGDTPPARPRAWVLDQLGPEDPAVFPGLPGTTDLLRLWNQERALQKADPAAASKARLSLNAYKQDGAAQLAYALTTDAPFRERLVWFWANHFTVSTRRGVDVGLTGGFVREAIRPHVVGRFSDMLLAVMRHPAMLLYLDNAASAGPDSPAGLRKHLGLNENLGRESLELHTVTQAAGYTQADVTAYSAILTGWSVDLKQEPPGFRFRPEIHEPGPKTLMGRRFEEGEAGGVAALEFLGTHPATYRSIATKLARHFIADAPPPDVVARIAAALQRSGGDLGVAAAAVVREPGAWVPLTKLRTPQEYIVAVLRASGAPGIDPVSMLGVLNALGQPLWSAPLPNGWPDRAADWADPETLLRRADWAYRLSGRLGDAEPAQMAQASLGGLLQPATLTAVQHAADRRDALTLLFTSPEFMRR
jgi:uncharacterized protein (DUF1800 family)